MATTLVHAEMDTILFTATTTAKSSGDICEIGELVGIAKVDIAAAGTGAAAISGVWAISKNTGVPITQGDSVYWDTTDAELNLVATNNHYAGKAYAVVTTAQATVNVLLNIAHGHMLITV